MLDLKNCPFCGGKAELSVRGMTAVSRATDLKYYAVVNCPSCEASVCGEATDDEDEAQPLAVAAWNRRSLQAVGPEPAIAVKWEQLTELINAAVKVAIRTGSDFHIDADKLREFACSALVATPPAEAKAQFLPCEDGEFNGDEFEDELTPDELARIDAAWETHKAAVPVAIVIDDNRPGRTAIIEIITDPPTLVVGSKLYAEPKAVTVSATPPAQPVVEAIDRDTLGQMVREAWVRWAQTQESPKPSWLIPYPDLPETDKEADRQIGETIFLWSKIHIEASAALAAKDGRS